jgi:3-oxoacyl-[acyl-carrier-protein] synthase-3
MRGAPRGVRLVATGSYVPERVLTNGDFEKLVDTSDEWITTRTGIKERRIAPPDMPTSELALRAAEATLEQAGLTAEDLDTIIVATVTGDQPFPSTACHVQAKLGATAAAAFDVGAACSGFLYGLSVGTGLVSAGLKENALVIGVESLSKIVDYTDRNTCVLFGDAAGAALLVPSASPHTGVLAALTRSDGSLSHLLELPAGGTRLGLSHDTIDARLHFLRMRGNETFKIAVRHMADIALEALARAGKSPAELDLLVPHQANIRIIEAVARALDFPMEKVMVNIDRYGNTSSASVPLALDEARRSGRIKDGDLVELVAFGGGMTWGAVVIQW